MDKETEQRSGLEIMARAIYQKFVESQNPMTTYYPPWEEMENPLNRDLWLGMAKAGMEALVLDALKR
jgi:hypothetical protein